jgi:hypothetical protein
LTNQKRAQSSNIFNITLIENFKKYKNILLYYKKILTLMFTKSEKGHDLICHENYTFKIGRIGKTRILWRCTVKTCSATLYTQLNYEFELENLEIERGYNHEPIDGDINKKKYYEKIKEMMSLTNNPPRNIFNTILRGCDSEVIKNVGKKEAICKKLREFRRRTINPNPYKYPIVKLSNILSVTHTNEKFYQFGPDNLRDLESCEDILIFYSQSQILNLSLNNTWSIDGTFQVVPKPFYQLFSISYISNNMVFPSIFIILKNKKQSTYERMFKIIKTLNNNLNPIKVISVLNML